MQYLSPRQHETLDYIREHIDTEGVVPTRTEIAQGLGIGHVSTVVTHISALMRKGWIEISPGSPRNIRLLREKLPVMVARIDDDVTLKRFVRVDERHVELRPESTDPERYRTIEIDLAHTELHIAGIAMDALIGQGFSPVEHSEATA